MTATEDVDLLLDARRSLVVLADDPEAERSLIGLLRRVDRSFSASRQSFRAVNRDGFLVDPVRPVRNPPWRDERSRVGTAGDDLDAVAITGLVWIENAPVLRAVAIDQRGFPPPSSLRTRGPLRFTSYGCRVRRIAMPSSAVGTLRKPMPPPPW